VSNTAMSVPSRPRSLRLGSTRPLNAAAMILTNALLDRNMVFADNMINSRELLFLLLTAAQS
jgi:hypothetical protein